MHLKLAALLLTDAYVPNSSRRPPQLKRVPLGGATDSRLLNNRIVLGPLIAAGFYGLLWGVTALLGRTQIRAAVLQHLRETAGVGHRREPKIDVWAFAPAPLLIIVHYRLQCAPVDARGAREVHVWLLGAHVRVHTTDMWIS